ncbi:MAG TPA: XdhC/CoxI family protein [Candidatus Sulfotelmatobacter sp.]|jgi:xanthine dehydrogenase accessory factor|nr:XdhC/CoxI family protein [Candidatus Sulfotelmatobacter sp.]
MPSVEEELARRLERGEEVVLATVIKLDGEPPSQPGAKLLMSGTTGIAGTLGCSEFDTAALADAPAVARSATPQLRTYRHDLGSIEVYLEPYASAPTLLVFAATPVARALVRWAPEVGFRPVLVGKLADLPPAAGGDLYVVHTNHDAEDLVAALEAVLPRDPKFIGLVGSRRHTGHHLEALRAKGVPEAVIARIQSPVGLELGARTAQEIALSILAGLVAVRHGAQGGWKQGPPA